MESTKPVYRLFMFKLANGTKTVTRGETREQAREYFERIIGAKIVEEFDYNYCGAAFIYSISHAFNWLEIAPLWLGAREIVKDDFTFQDKFRNSFELSRKFHLCKTEKTAC